MVALLMRFYFQQGAARDPKHGNSGGGSNANTTSTEPVSSGRLLRSQLARRI